MNDFRLKLSRLGKMFLVTYYSSDFNLINQDIQLLIVYTDSQLQLFLSKLNTQYFTQVPTLQIIMNQSIQKIFDVFTLEDGQINMLNHSLEQPAEKYSKNQKNQALPSTIPISDSFLSSNNQEKKQADKQKNMEIQSQMSPKENQNDCVEAEELSEDFEQENQPSNIQEPSHIDTGKDNLDEQDSRNRQSKTSSESEIYSKSQKIEKNDSKNVPKGMMKAYAHSILDKDPRNVKMLTRYFEQAGISFESYKQFARKIRKSSKISIRQIRDMLMTEQFGSTTRTLGFYFIRKRFVSHIFNSKMQKRHIHMKYIERWRQIFGNPEDFTCLK